MKLQPDTFSHAITAYGDGWIDIGTTRVEHNLLLDSDGQHAPWAHAGFDALTSADFEQLLTSQPELVLFGSGNQLRFPQPVWVRPLIEAGIGIETMDTAAACRTYNILASENRRVIAALLLRAPA